VNFGGDWRVEPCGANWLVAGGRKGSVRPCGWGGAGVNCGSGGGYGGVGRVSWSVAGWPS